MQILEKGTTPICVSDLSSVRLTGKKTDPFTLWSRSLLSDGSSSFTAEKKLSDVMAADN